MNQTLGEEKRFKETEDGCEFLLAGQQVILIQFGCFYVDLTVGTQESVYIRLGMPFAWRHEDASQVFDPADVPSLAPLLPLVGTFVQKVTATKSGFLSLAFSNGVSIEAPTGEDGHDYEAWQISDSQGFLAVCAVGGEVFFFLPEDRVSL